MAEQELTQEQTDRQDVVDNICYNVMVLLAKGGKVDWNIEHIADVRDVVQEIVCSELQLMTPMEFYPFIEREGIG